MSSSSRIVLTAAALLAAACGKPSSASPESKPSASATTPTTSAATAKAAPAATSAAAVPMALPPDRTAAPTLAEWNAQKTEVTVKGSSALHCETKMVREYLRISCHDKDDSGGTPSALTVQKGGREALTFAASGVTSLIVPFLDGTHVEATFSWTDKSYPLTLDWPKGSKMPTVLGSFAGAKSPLDGTAAGDAQKLCDCHKKVTGSATCADLLGEANADCDRTYGKDCTMLLACSRGEPGAAPSCLSGFINGMPSGQCHKLCKATTDCPKGQTCDADGLGHTACLDD